MEILIEKKGDVLVVAFLGNLDTNSSPEAEAKVNEELANNPEKMVIDLGKCDFVSSAGLRVFLSTAKQISGKGGLLKLCGANEVVKDVLEMSGFTSFIELKENLDAAIADFN